MVDQNEAVEKIEETMDELDGEIQTFAFSATDGDDLVESMDVGEGFDMIFIVASLIHTISESSGNPVEEVSDDVTEIAQAIKDSEDIQGDSDGD